MTAFNPSLQASLALPAQLGQLFLSQATTSLGLLSQAATTELEEGRARLKAVTEQSTPDATALWTNAGNDAKAWFERNRDLGKALWESHLATFQSAGEAVKAPLADVAAKATKTSKSR